MKRFLLPGLAGLLFIAGCTGSDSGEKMLLGVEPCLAQAGQSVTAIWYSPQGSDTITFNDTELPTTPTDSSRTKFRFTVPGSTPHGDYLVASQSTLTVGTPITIPESEPNDNTNGSNATNATRNRAATGELSSVTDKDHFNFDCMLGTTYEITVSPHVVSQVFVDGVAIPLDASGKGRFIPSRESALIGLTGATGVYSISIGLPSS